MIKEYGSIDNILAIVEPECFYDLQRLKRMSYSENLSEYLSFNIYLKVKQSEGSNSNKRIECESVSIKLYEITKPLICIWYIRFLGIKDGNKTTTTLREIRVYCKADNSFMFELKCLYAPKIKFDDILFEANRLSFKIDFNLEIDLLICLNYGQVSCFYLKSQLDEINASGNNTIKKYFMRILNDISISEVINLSIMRKLIIISGKNIIMVENETIRNISDIMKNYLKTLLDEELGHEIGYIKNSITRK